MKIFFRAVLFVVLAALGFWLWTILFPSPEKIIRGQLTKLAQDVSFSQNENNLVKIARAQSVADFFSTNVEINLNVPGRESQSFAGRDEITQAAMASRQAASALDVKFPDINITIAPDENSATADVTVEATVSGQRDAIVQEMKFTFQKTEGKWLITKVETIQTLSILNFNLRAIIS